MKWLVHKKGVEPVEVVSATGDSVFVQFAHGTAVTFLASDVFDTEADARREHVDREACALEEQADRHDRQRVDAEVLASSHMDDAEWNRVKADEARARAKFLRDGLAVGWVAPSGGEGLEVYPEVKDATDGRR